MQLRVVSPQAVLERGFSITTDGEGRVVRSAAAVKKGDVLTTRVADGEITSTVGKPRQASFILIRNITHGSDFMAKEEKPKSFEVSVAELEKIVGAIESGQIGLEESLAKYEQGMELVKRCRGILERAEKRIEQLTANGDGISGGAAVGCERRCWGRSDGDRVSALSWRVVRWRRRGFSDRRVWRDGRGNRRRLSRMSSGDAKPLRAMAGSGRMRCRARTRSWPEAVGQAEVA